MQRKIIFSSHNKDANVCFHEQEYEQAKYEEEYGTSHSMYS